MRGRGGGRPEHAYVRAQGSIMVGSGLAQEKEGAVERPGGGGEVAEEGEHEGGAGGDAEGGEELDIEGFAHAEAAGGERDGGEDGDDGEDGEQIAEGEIEFEGAGEGGGCGGEQQEIGEGEQGGSEQVAGVFPEEVDGVVGAAEEGAETAAAFQALQKGEAVKQVAGEEEGCKGDGGERKAAIRRRAGRASSNAAKSRSRGRRRAQPARRVTTRPMARSRKTEVTASVRLPGWSRAATTARARSPPQAPKRKALKNWPMKNPR